MKAFFYLNVVANLGVEIRELNYFLWKKEEWVTEINQKQEIALTKFSTPPDLARTRDFKEISPNPRRVDY